MPARWCGVEKAGNPGVMERIFDGPGFGVGILAHELAHRASAMPSATPCWHEAWLSAGFTIDFGPWLDRPGCPELGLAWDGEGVTVTQVQDGEPFRFLLPLAWRDAEGTAQHRDFRIEERATRIELGAGFSAPQVDPDVELLYRKAR